MFKSRRMYKDFVSGIKGNRYASKEVTALLNAMPIRTLRKIGKTIIYADYDGYNDNDKCSELAYFDNLDRWQKEFFVEQRLHKLYS